MHFLYGPAGFGAGKSTCQLTYNLQNTFAGTLQQGIALVILTYFIV